jgi:uncharacterized protein (DUF1015 family)
MADLVPFRALRPVPEAAARVAAVPYDVVSTEEARALAADPLSFLHVSRAEIDLPTGTSPYADEVYDTASRNFEALRSQAPLVTEEEPSVYVYRLRMGTHVQTGVAACFSVDEYEQERIRKHERTRRDKEDDRTRHIMALRAQTGPVFLTYRAGAAIDAVVDRATGSAPLYDFTAADGVMHTLWRADRRLAAELVREFAGVSTLYIADGHHRAASAARAREQLRATDEKRGASDADTFLAVAFPDNQMQVLPYNRTVRDLRGSTPAELLERLRERFPVQPGPPAPARRGEVAMFLDGRWHTIALGTGQAGAPPVERLDVSLLQELILAPMLGIGDVRTDPRIDFVGGARGTTTLERTVTAGHAAVAFSLYPVGVDDLMAVADAGGIMPPKSTWFEPKLRDGLLSHVI